MDTNHLQTSEWTSKYVFSGLKYPLGIKTKISSCPQMSNSWVSIHTWLRDSQRLDSEYIPNRVVVSNIFYFYPYLGRIPILTNMFQRGWNRQLAKEVSWVNASNLLFISTVDEFIISYLQRAPVSGWCLGSGVSIKLLMLLPKTIEWIVGKYHEF